jgi:glycosyltransferase involved in cell wall biosynthesis
LAVLSSDSLKALVAKGFSPTFLKEYYNPKGIFDQIYWLHPEDRNDLGVGLHLAPTRAFWIKRTLRKIRPTVVRGYGRNGELAIKNRLPGVPVIASVHDTNPDEIPPNIRNADRVICMSRAVRQVVMQLGARENAISILPNRVNLDVFRPLPVGSGEPIRHLFPGKRLVLHIGRKTKQKNLDTVLRAMQLLGVDYTLLAVGRGEEVYYRKLARLLGIENRVFFQQSISHEQLPSYYNASDCFCTPSRWEGFGVVFIEAAACGAAIITSNIAPMNEYLSHGQSAFLIDDYENPNSVAAAIRGVCDDAGLRSILSVGARQAAMPFDQKVVGEAEAAIYLDTIKSTRVNST